MNTETETLRRCIEMRETEPAEGLSVPNPFKGFNGAV